MSLLIYAFFYLCPFFSGRQLGRKRRVGCKCGHADPSSLCEYEPARTAAIFFSSPKEYLHHEMSESLIDTYIISHKNPLDGSCDSRRFANIRTLVFVRHFVDIGHIYVYATFSVLFFLKRKYVDMWAWCVRMRLCVLPF